MRASERDFRELVRTSRVEAHTPPSPTGEDELLLQDNRRALLEALFACATPLQVEAATGFARYLSSVGITSGNHQLFLRLLESNNRWVVDALIGPRDPRLLFSSIRLSAGLVGRAFLLLSAWHPGQIYRKVLQAVLGIIECAYYQPDDGYQIYRLKIADLNSLGKFLDESRDQFDPNNDVLLSALDRITQLGQYEGNQRKHVLAKHAFDIRIAYFDNRKRCIDVIPQLLMVRLEREQSETQPAGEYQSYISRLAVHSGNENHP
jgi:hypothetical protein